MKTGGGTLRRQILANFDPPAVYPQPGVDRDMLKANTSLEYLMSLSPERRERIRFFSGHFPFLAVELLGENLTTITILRDPVERTLSFLRQYRSQRKSLASAPLEGIYEHPFVFNPYLKDHQAKLFSLSAEDAPKSFLHGLDVDAARLRQAKRNLARIDFVGTLDRYGQLVSRLEGCFGWRLPHIEHRHVTEREDVPDSFRRRIAEDNPADMDFYAHAIETRERWRPRGPMRQSCASQTRK